MKHETKHLRRAQIIRNAILKSQAVACALFLFSLIAFTSCQDDDDFQDYTDYITGSWSTDEIDVITHQPTGNPGSYTWTFKADGTGLWVNSQGSSPTYTPYIMSEFRYTVKEYGGETGLWYDFCIDFTFLKENGDTDWDERLYLKKRSKNCCEMYNDGHALFSILHRK